MDTFKPWTKYPSLTMDRMSAIATLLRDVRHEAVAKHEPEIGDSEWSLGCRIYSRSCFAIAQASAKYDWLDVLSEQEPLRFSFTIGKIPFRFYKGEADDPPGKYIETTFAELHQQQLLLEIEGVHLADVVLRLAIETDSARQASKVILVELNEAGTVTNTYIIPFDAQPVTIPLRTPGVSLPPVVLPTVEETATKKVKEEAK